jgi:hypothetical protein
MDANLTLQQWWSRTCAYIETSPHSDAQIGALERRYGLTIPEDFRHYLSLSCPVSETFDDDLGTWWPLERIRNIPEEYPSFLDDTVADGGRKFLFFLDHSIWCWAWSISCADDDTRGKVFLVVGPGGRFVADSFTEFVERYTTDWISVC